MSLGANGLSVRTQSVLSVLIGGIAFETFVSSGDAKPAAEEAIFTLYNDRAEAAAQREVEVTPYVLRFKESVRGLSVGAPVTYLGLQVGEVTAVGLEGDPKTGDIHPRVDIVISLGKFLGHMRQAVSVKELAMNEKLRHSILQRMVDRGLRAQLRSGSIVTGQLYVACDMHKHVPKVKIDWTKSPAELPVVPSGLQDLQDKINGILVKIEKIPIDAIGEDLKKLVARLDGLLKRTDEEVLPEAKKTLEELKGVLKSVDTTVVGKDAPVQQEVREALQEINRAAQAIRGLTEYLEQHPEAIIRGKTQEKQ
jgi:paraquat-inducible protein B